MIGTLNYRMDSSSVHGFFLALTTAILWGVLPIFLKISLDAMDSATITTYRFYSAALIVGLILYAKSRLPSIRSLTKLEWALFALAAVMLVLNYIGTVEGLVYLKPESAQVLMQLAPFLLMLGGLVFFNEVFTRLQFLGAGILISGLLLFFNQRLEGILESNAERPLGIILIIVAAACWAIYALCQKPLLKTLSAQQLTLLIYVFGGTLLLPITQFSSVLTMNGLQLFALLFCCANTLIAYGAFTKALAIWEASKVSAVIATSPLFTLLANAVAAIIWPDLFSPSHLDSLAYLGVGFVIAGSMLTALGRKETPA